MFLSHKKLFFCFYSIDLVILKQLSPSGSVNSVRYVYTSTLCVSVYTYCNEGFTNKLKLVMKGNELELWIASLTTCNFITVQSNC